MRRCLLFSLLFLCLSCSFSICQTKGSKASSSGSAPTQLTATGVAPNDVVISIDNFCDQDLLLVGTIAQNPAAKESAGNAKSATCKVDVTRAEFEQMIDTVESTMKSSNRIRIAVQYPEYLAFAQKARELQLDKDPQFLERMKLNYLQVLSRTYNIYLAKKAGEVSDAEVEKFYKEHPETFDQVNLMRIFVPRVRIHETMPDTPAELDELRAKDAAEMKALAQEIRNRAAAGEDFQKLQAEATKAAGEHPDDAPDVDLGMTTRDEIPQEYRKVFDLKIGEVSEVTPTPQGWYICKILSRDKIPLSKARTVLVRIRLQDFTNVAKNSVKTSFNDNYFNTPHGMEPAKSSPGPK